ncbi:MAG: plastocyanin [Sphingobacteriales bacterium]|jgi:plastocyanin
MVTKFTQFLFPIILGCTAVLGQTTHTISVEVNKYVPADAVMAPGDTLEFKWVAGSHPTQSDDQLWETFQMNSTNTSKKIILTTPGVSTYFCTSLAQANSYPGGMTGQITVQDQATAVKRAESAKPEIYPNPANNILNLVIPIDQNGMLNVKLFNILGKEVLSLHNDYVEQGIFKGKVRIDDLPNGLYILNIQLNDKVLAVKKVTKK